MQAADETAEKEQEAELDGEDGSDSDRNVCSRVGLHIDGNLNDISIDRRRSKGVINQ